MRARRVAAIWLPGLPLQVAGRDDPTLHDRPVAVTDGTLVLARNRLAARAGIGVGMRMAEAMTHAPDLLCIPHDPRETQAIWDAALDALDTLGPIVEDAGLGEALVDLSGVGGNERALLRRSLHTLDALLALSARAAVADGPFVATVAARRASPTKPVTIVPREKGAAFLAPLPVALLPLLAAMQADLVLLGIRTIGSFAALRPSDIRQRFGHLGMAALTLAIGQDDRPLLPRPRDRQETRTHTFDPPVDDLAPVLFVSKALLDAHATTLRRDGLVAAALRLTLTFEGRDPLVIDQRWSLAVVPGATELDALRLALDAQVRDAIGDALPSRIIDVTITLRDCAPDAGMQLPLIGGATIQRRQAVARLLTRLRATLDPLDVVEDVPVVAHLPEDQWTMRPYDATRIGTPQRMEHPPDAALVPAVPGFFLCRPPEPVTVVGEGSALASVVTGEEKQPVLVALGPYRADGKWWQGGGHLRAYWLVLTGDRALHLLMEDRQQGGWCRVGMFD